MENTLNSQLLLLNCGLEAGQITSKTICEECSFDQVYLVMQKIIEQYLFSSSSSTRQNSFVLLHMLTNKFSQSLLDLLIQESQDLDESLLKLSDLDLEHMYQYRNKIELNGGYLHIESDIGLFSIHKNDKNTLKKQRRKLYQYLGINEKLSKDKEGMDYIHLEIVDDIITASDVHIQISDPTPSQSDYQSDNNNNNNNMNINDSITSIDIIASSSSSSATSSSLSSSWLLYTIRNLSLYLLDSRWEYRHGSALGLLAILSALLPSQSISSSSSSSFPSYSSSSFTSSSSTVTEVNSSSVSNLSQYLIEDILCSSICVLLFDTFLDFSDSKGSIISPVKFAVSILITQLSKSLYSITDLDKLYTQMSVISSDVSHPTMDKHIYVEEDTTTTIISDTSISSGVHTVDTYPPSLNLIITLLQSIFWIANIHTHHSDAHWTIPHGALITINQLLSTHKLIILYIPELQNIFMNILQQGILNSNDDLLYEICRIYITFMKIWDEKYCHVLSIEVLYKLMILLLEGIQITNTYLNELCRRINILFDLQLAFIHFFKNHLHSLLSPSEVHVYTLLQLYLKVLNSSILKLPLYAVHIQVICYEKLYQTLDILATCLEYLPINHINMLVSTDNTTGNTDIHVDYISILDSILHLTMSIQMVLLTSCTQSLGDLHLSNKVTQNTIPTKSKSNNNTTTTDIAIDSPTPEAVHSSSSSSSHLKYFSYINPTIGASSESSYYSHIKARSSSSSISNKERTTFSEYINDHMTGGVETASNIFSTSTNHAVSQHFLKDSIDTLYSQLGKSTFTLLFTYISNLLRESNEDHITDLSYVELRYKCMFMVIYEFLHKMLLPSMVETSTILSSFSSSKAILDVTTKISMNTCYDTSRSLLSETNSVNRIERNMYESILKCIEECRKSHIDIFDLNRIHTNEVIKYSYYINGYISKSYSYMKKQGQNSAHTIPSSSSSYSGYSNKWMKVCINILESIVSDSIPTAINKLNSTKDTKVIQKRKSDSTSATSMNKPPKKLKFSLISASTNEVIRSSSKSTSQSNSQKKMYSVQFISNALDIVLTILMNHIHHSFYMYVKTDLFTSEVVKIIDKIKILTQSRNKWKFKIIQDVLEYCITSQIYTSNSNNKIPSLDTSPIIASIFEYIRHQKSILQSDEKDITNIKCYIEYIILQLCLSDSSTNTSTNISTYLSGDDTSVIQYKQCTTIIDNTRFHMDPTVIAYLINYTCQDATKVTMVVEISHIIISKCSELFQLYMYDATLTTHFSSPLSRFCSVLFHTSEVIITTISATFMNISIIEASIAMRQLLAYILYTLPYMKNESLDITINSYGIIKKLFIYITLYFKIYSEQEQFSGDALYEMMDMYIDIVLTTIKYLHVHVHVHVSTQNRQKQDHKSINTTSLSFSIIQQVLELISVYLNPHVTSNTTTTTLDSCDLSSLNDLLKANTQLQETMKSICSVLLYTLSYHISEHLLVEVYSIFLHLSISNMSSFFPIVREYCTYTFRNLIPLASVRVKHTTYQSSYSNKLSLPVTSDNMTVTADYELSSVEMILSQQPLIRITDSTYLQDAYILYYLNYYVSLLPISNIHLNQIGITSTNTSICNLINNNDLINHSSSNIQLTMLSSSRTTSTCISDKQDDTRKTHSLRNYQIDGVTWLTHLRRHHLHGCLADDMGLGKTIQILTSIVLGRIEKIVQKHHSKYFNDRMDTMNESKPCPASSHLPTHILTKTELTELLMTSNNHHHHHLSSHNSMNYPHLVICPTSVVHHWANEIKKFFPECLLYSCVYHPTVDQSLWDERTVVICSYDMLRIHFSHFAYIPSTTVIQTKAALTKSMHTQDSESVQTRQTRIWNTIILDEGHIIKNPKTAIAKCIFQLKGLFRIVSTATPVQNQVEELWSLLNFLMPDFLGDHTTFMKQVVRPIGKNRKQKEKLFPFLSQAPSLFQDKTKDIYTSETNTNMKKSSKSTTVTTTAVTTSDTTTPPTLDASGLEILYNLHKQVLPFIFRRMKSMVAQDLPPKTIIDIYTSLSEIQSQLYQEFLQQIHMNDERLLMKMKLLQASSKSTENIEEKSDFTKLNKTNISKKTIIDNTSDNNSAAIHPFQAIFYLKLLCIHPALVISNAHKSYKKRLLDNISNSGKVVKLVQLLLQAQIVELDECHPTYRYLLMEGGEDTMKDNRNGNEDECNSDREREEEESEEEGQEQKADDSDDDDKAEEDKCNDEAVNTGLSSQQSNLSTPASTSVASLDSHRNGSTTRHSIRKLMESISHNTVASTSQSSSKCSKNKSKTLLSRNEVATPSSYKNVKYEDTGTAYRSYDHKCLIFCHHLQVIELLQSILMKSIFPSIQYGILSGGTPLPERIRLVENFNTPTHPLRILFLTARSCGLGLNLIGADTVIFIEHDWNPYVDLQAIDRAHRIGQNKPVTVYRLIAENTIENKIISIQDYKESVVSEIIDDTNAGHVQDPTATTATTTTTTTTTTKENVSSGFYTTLWDSLSNKVTSVSSAQTTNSSTTSHVNSHYRYNKETTGVEDETLDLNEFLKSIPTFDTF